MAATSICPYPQNINWKNNLNRYVFQTKCSTSDILHNAKFSSRIVREFPKKLQNLERVIKIIRYIFNISHTHISL